MDEKTKYISYGIEYPIHTLGMIHEILQVFRYKPGYTFALHADGGSGATKSLQIEIDTLDPVTRQPVLVTHRLPIPPVSWPWEEWEDWIRDQVILVERHEICEWIEINGKRPYVPEHGLNAQPYKLRRIA
jgi:hypothetical protein